MFWQHLLTIKCSDRQDTALTQSDNVTIHNDDKTFPLARQPLLDSDEQEIKDNTHEAFLSKNI